ncbi:MAG: Rab family GTPase [Promethearchaeota archaeon]
MVNYSAKIVLLGQGSVGKTSLIRRYVQHTFTHDYITTIGSNFLIKKICLDREKNINITLQLWDLSGQDSFRTIRARYYLHARGGILVFDLTRPSTLQQLEKWQLDFTQKVGIVPLMLFGNKCDLRDQISVDQEEAETMALKLGATYFTTSALDGTNVETGFFNLATKIIDHITEKRKELRNQ